MSGPEDEGARSPVAALFDAVADEYDQTGVAACSRTPGSWWGVARAGAILDSARDQDGRVVVWQDIRYTLGVAR